MATRHPLECHSAPYRESVYSALEEVWPFDSVLDVGCATGSMLDDIKTRWPGATLYGLDLDHELLKRAGHEAFVAKLPYGLSCLRTKSVDVVMACSVFELFSPEARVSMLSDMYRIAKRAVIIGGSVDGVWSLSREMVT